MRRGKEALAPDKTKNLAFGANEKKREAPPPQGGKRVPYSRGSDMWGFFWGKKGGKKKKEHTPGGPEKGLIEFGRKKQLFAAVQVSKRTRHKGGEKEGSFNRLAREDPSLSNCRRERCPEQNIAKGEKKSLEVFSKGGSTVGEKKGGTTVVKHQISSRTSKEKGRIMGGHTNWGGGEDYYRVLVVPGKKRAFAAGGTRRGRGWGRGGRGGHKDHKTGARWTSK